MKTAQELDKARHTLAAAMLTRGLSDMQLTILSGAVIALAWMADDPNGSTLERLLSGEPIDTGPTSGSEHAGSLERLRDALIKAMPNA